MANTIREKQFHSGLTVKTNSSGSLHLHGRLVQVLLLLHERLAMEDASLGLRGQQPGHLAQADECVSVGVLPPGHVLHPRGWGRGSAARAPGTAARRARALRQAG